jgi:hypothetical protein
MKKNYYVIVNYIGIRDGYGLRSKGGSYFIKVEADDEGKAEDLALDDIAKELRSDELIIADETEVADAIERLSMCDLDEEEFIDLGDESEPFVGSGVGAQRAAR